MDLIVIAVYIGAMIGIGFYAKGKAKSEADFLVAGRRLGPVLYSGTMAAVVIGGASTIGGVGLGYKYGISGMWLVFSIGCGILFLSLVFAGRINRLKVFTVSQMLELRYGPGANLVSGIVMWAYTLMLAVTSTIAYGTVFGVLFDIGKVPAIIIGGAVVVLYSVLGGMWSITITDFVQFVIKTVGIFFVLLPAALIKAGGFAGLAEKLPDTAFSLTGIGGSTIVTYFVIYFFGLVIGQDIWQRVFTARSDKVAKWAGTASGVYCLLYAVAGALIGMSAAALLPNLAESDDAFPAVVQEVLPQGVAGLVVAAALAAIMSTSSGALIATATVAKEDIVNTVLRRRQSVAHPGRARRRASDAGAGARRGRPQPLVHPRFRCPGDRRRLRHQRRGRRADRRLRHPRRRPAGRDPRRHGLEAGHHQGRARQHCRRHHRDPGHDGHRRRHLRQRAGLRRAGRQPRRIHRGQPGQQADPRRCPCRMGQPDRRRARDLPAEL